MGNNGGNNEKNGRDAVLIDSDFSLNANDGSPENRLRSLDLFILGFATAVVGRSFAVICFFNFVTWLGHYVFLNFTDKTNHKITNPIAG